MQTKKAADPVQDEEQAIRQLVDSWLKANQGAMISIIGIIGTIGAAVALSVEKSRKWILKVLGRKPTDDEKQDDAADGTQQPAAPAESDGGVVKPQDGQGH